MQDLSHYNAAAFLSGGMKAGPQYVRIIRGPRAGTVGQVVAVHAKYYSDHSYQLSVKGRRKFWVAGKDLEYVADHNGDTSYVVDPDYCITHHDMMGRTLSVDQTILFHRSSDGIAEMVVGTIKRISKAGAVYAKVFRASRSIEPPANLVKIGIPSSTMIVDREMVDQVLLAKLSAL